MTPTELRAAIARLGLSSDEFCRTIGVTRSALTRWLNGSRAIPDMLPLAIDGIRHRRMMQAAE